MGNTEFKLLLCLCSFLLSLLSCGAHENCAQFAFGKLNSTEITAVVNTLVTLSFTVNYSKCERRYNYTALIYRNGVRICRISFSNGICTNSPNITFCFCESNVGPLTFNKIVKKEDTGIWLWKAMKDDFQIIALTEIYFKIISLSKIISLTVDGREEPQITLRKKDVYPLICSWINGNPPGTAKLLLNDKVLNSSRASGNISFQFSANPEPNGVVIRCDADGSERNMSTVLFIYENRPVFLNSSFKSVEVRAGKTFNCTFSLRVHEPERLQCNLSMTKPFGVDVKPRLMNGKNCSVIWSVAETLNSKFLIQQNSPKIQAPGSLQENCVCSFSGTPPNLSLTFFMQNDIKEQDLGSWRLTVSNSDGIDHQDFFLFVIKDRPVFLNSSFKSVEVRAGKTFNCTFSLRVHEPERLQCNLSMTKSFGVDVKPRLMNGKNCSVIWSVAETLNSKFLIQQNSPKIQAPGSLQENCVCSFSGTPPNLSLTFFMQNDIKEQDLGSWRLTVSNSDGIDHQDFFLFVIKEDKVHGEGISLVAIGLLGSILAVVVASSFAYVVRANICHQKILKSEEPTKNRAKSKSQCQSVSDIDHNNLLPIHKLDRSRNSGFLDINSLIVQE